MLPLVHYVAHLGREDRVLSHLTLIQILLHVVHGRRVLALAGDGNSSGGKRIQVGGSAHRLVQTAGPSHLLPPRHELGLRLTACAELGGVAGIWIQHRVVLSLHLLLFLLIGHHLGVHGLSAGVLDQEVLASRQVSHVVVSLRIQILLIDPVLVVHLRAGAEVLQVRPLRRVASGKQPVVVHGRVAIGAEACGPWLLARRSRLPSLPSILIVHVTLVHV